MGIAYETDPWTGTKFFKKLGTANIGYRKNT